MGWTYDEYRRQPARVVMRWRAMLGIENQARVERAELDELKARLANGRGN